MVIIDARSTVGAVLKTSAGLGVNPSKVGETLLGVERIHLPLGWGVRNCFSCLPLGRRVILVPTMFGEYMLANSVCQFQLILLGCIMMPTKLGGDRLSAKVCLFSLSIMYINTPVVMGVLKFQTAKVVAAGYICSTPKLMGVLLIHLAVVSAGGQAVACIISQKFWRDMITITPLVMGVIVFSSHSKLV